MGEYFVFEKYNVVLLALGFVVLLAATVPVIMKQRRVTAPIIYLAIGGSSLFFTRHLSFEPLEHLDIIKKVTEFVTLVALTNAGLKIKAPFRWHTWRYSMRLLLIAMPVTIIAAAYLSWWIVGLAPATAMLFGAIISPTDPVLASELQTSEPSKEDTSKIKLALTSEAGINDGLAFPFTYLAIVAATNGYSMDWAFDWFSYYFVIKIVLGLGIGLLIGWLLCRLVFSLGSRDELGKISRGIIAIALTLLPYAATEIVGGYGFLAVFAAACIFSNYEKHEKHMDSLHDFNEELESMVVAVIFLVVGAFIAYHYEIFLDVKVVAVAMLMVFVVRPISGYISLTKTKLNGFEKFVLSFYGIRGIGSLFYFAYALTEADFKDTTKLLEITMTTIFLSVFVHGLSAKTIQKKIKKYES
ncbi:MAG: sodium:proton exchanger [Flavobacterium sp.]|nr:MAG: sodium:proton exchanger [Flavobacterium sp.]